MIVLQLDDVTVKINHLINTYKKKIQNFILNTTSF
jgi:hypothetical protein